jgi:two-component system, NtrC family, sensor kinase
MTAVSEDTTADLNRRIAELEERLATALTERDAAIERQTASALVNFRLQSEFRAAAERQHASAEILRAISESSGDAERSLTQIAETTARLFGAPSVTIRIAEGDEWIKTIRVGASSQASGAQPGSQSAAPGANLPATVYQENRQIHIPDMDNLDPSMANWPLAATRDAGARTVSGTPLRRRDKAIGALIVYRDCLAPFTTEELALQQSFADQAVIAIENTRLFNETKEALERQTATADILKVIASSPSDVQPVFEAVVRTAQRLLRRELAFILRCDATHFWAVANAGLEGPVPVRNPAPVAIDPAINFPSRAIVSKENLVVPDWSSTDLPEQERHIRDIYGLNSALYLPLLRGGECIGVLGVGDLKPGAFSEAEIALAESFRDQAVIAIENTRLFNETKEALERQTATADILKVIASSPSDVRPVFAAIAERARSLLGGFSSTVYRFIDGQVSLEAFTPTTPEADEVLTSTFPMPIARFAPFEIVQAGEVAQIPDTESLTGEILDIARARGFRSLLFAPLMNQDTAIGLIAVTRASAGTFAGHHVQLLKTFADQAVIAIENARLFDEVQARTADLQESLQQQTATADVLKVISRSTFDLQTVLETLIKSAVELSGGNRGSIFLREGDVFPLKAASSTTPEFLQYWAANPPKAGRGSATSRVIASGKVEIIPDVLEDPEMQMPTGALVRIRGTLGVPMLRDNKVEGVLVLTRPEPGPFSKSQIDLVQTFADQAVIAVENVRLFDEAQARTRELAKSLDDLRTAQDRLIQTEKLASLGQLTAGIAHEIKNPLNFVNNFAALSAELTDELNDALKPAVLDETIRAEVDELTGLLKDNLGKVVQHGKRADSIVKNMLLHSREGSGDHRPADVNALVEESLNLAYHGARAEKPQFNVTLQRDFDPDAGMIEAFPQEITRVLLNLISNGFYAVAKRKAEDSDAAFEPVVSAATKGQGDHVEIRIRDNGTGIPPEVKEKMFNPFFTTKPAGEGTGLGLSMSHDIIVKQHGGTIDVDTQPGAFTEFTILLPRTSLPRTSQFSDKTRGQT